MGQRFERVAITRAVKRWRKDIACSYSKYSNTMLVHQYKDFIVLDIRSAVYGRRYVQLQYRVDIRPEFLSFVLTFISLIRISTYTVRIDVPFFSSAFITSG